MFVNKLLTYLTCALSQKVKGVLMWNLQHSLFSYEEEDIGRFSNQH